VRVHLKPALGRTKLESITPTHVRALYKEKLQSRSPRTVQYVHVALHKALKQAVDDGLIPRNVTEAFGALVAGISRMHWRTFLFYNVLAGAVWATASMFVGYLFSGSLDLVEEWMGSVTVLLVLLLILTLVSYLAYRWVANHRA
jgi:hypothetical protein